MKNTNIILLSLFFSFLTFAKNSGTSGVGNGGDPIRDAFFSIGKNIITVYNSGLVNIKSELEEAGISDEKKLANILTINNVHTSAVILKDNKGSVVSAIGIPGSITLYVGNELPSLSWSTLLLKTANSERLVLHEMLRANGVNDDNFLLTNKVLENQGRLDNDEFHFTWSKNNQDLISSALAYSFNAKNQENELNFFKNITQNLIEQNVLSYSDMLRPYLFFVQSIGESLTFNDALFLYRNAFRNFKILNNRIDQFESNPTDDNLNIFFKTSLRLIPSTMFFTKELNVSIVTNYIHSLIKFASNNNPMLLSMLHELESEIINAQNKSKINLKINSITQEL